MAETVAEKVIRLETQMSNVTSEVAEVKGLVKEVILKIDNITSLQNEVQNLKQDILELKKRTDRNKWVVPTTVGTVMTVMASVMTFLVISFITNN